MTIIINWSGFTNTENASPNNEAKLIAQRKLFLNYFTRMKYSLFCFEVHQEQRAKH